MSGVRHDVERCIEKLATQWPGQNVHQNQRHQSKARGAEVDDSAPVFSVKANHTHVPSTASGEVGDILVGVGASRSTCGLVSLLGFTG